jgi:hypothetical protein
MKDAEYNRDNMLSLRLLDVDNRVVLPAQT